MCRQAELLWRMTAHFMLLRRLLSAMSAGVRTELLPPSNEGMVVLDRARFQREVSLVAVQVAAKLCSRVLTLFHGSILDIPRQVLALRCN